MRTFVFILGLAPFFAAPAALFANTIQQIMPADRLEQIKSALPEVSHPELRAIFSSNQTLWYDHDVMTPAYQDSVGAGANATWPNLVAAPQQVINGFWNRQYRRWQFPFSTTAGTDNSTNAKVVNFVALPHVNGRVVTIPIRKVARNANRPQWDWSYPAGTVFGEIIFIKDGDGLLPSEIRTRKRFTSGWGMNIFRPFPTAQSLADAVKRRRPGWISSAKLAALVDFLEDNTTLVPKRLSATSAFSSTFHQDGWLDPLPDFGDQQLVRELLTTTPFASAYDTAWKINGTKVAYAPTTASSFSIVPNNYEVGVIQVTDDSCMRCHREAGRLVSEFNSDLYLYGELWGMDGIFSFHPYDESEFSRLRHSGNGIDGYYDNRKINPVLSRAGIFRMQNFFVESFAAAPMAGIDHEEAFSPNFGVSYSQQIKPVLDAHCVECHSPGGRRPTLSGFPFVRDGVGDDQEEIVELMLRRVSGQGNVMPPGARPPLSPANIALIREWLAGGLQP